MLSLNALFTAKFAYTKTTNHFDVCMPRFSNCGTVDHWLPEMLDKGKNYLDKQFADIFVTGIRENN
jgi:hypothetical protein